MADPIAVGQRIATTVGHPEVQYIRPVGGSTAPVPLLYVRWACTLDEMYVVSSTNVPPDGTSHLILYFMRGGVSYPLYNDVFYGFTANSREVLDTPGTELLPNDVVYLQITPANAVALPALIVGLQLELT